MPELLTLFTAHLLEEITWSEMRSLANAASHRLADPYQKASGALNPRPY